jgi:hypothetical protein
MVKYVYVRFRDGGGVEEPLSCRTSRIGAKPCECPSLYVEGGFSQTTQERVFAAAVYVGRILHIACRWRPEWLHQG